MQTKFTELFGLISAAQRNAAKLETGVRVEAARGRSSLSEAAKLIVQIRKDMLQAGKDVPKKTRTKKVASEETTEDQIIDEILDLVKSDVTAQPGERDDEIPPTPELKREVSDMPEPVKPRPKKNTGRKPKKASN